MADINLPNEEDPKTDNEQNELPELTDPPVESDKEDNTSKDNIELPDPDNGNSNDNIPDSESEKESELKSVEESLSSLHEKLDHLSAKSSDS